MSGNVSIVFVVDIWQQCVEPRSWAPSVDQLVRRHLRRFLYGCVVCEGHARKDAMPRLVLDIDVHDQHVYDGVI